MGSGTFFVIAIIVVLFVIPIATLVVRARRNDLMESGGSFGDQLGDDNKD